MYKHYERNYNKQLKVIPRIVKERLLKVCML